jgi:hypothetical protein
MEIEAVGRAKGGHKRAEILSQEERLHDDMPTAKLIYREK